MLRKLIAAAVCCAGLMLAGCSNTQLIDPTVACDTLCTITKAAASAESSVTIAAKGLETAVNLGAIKPGSDTAVAAKTALVAAGKALDAAEAYIKAGDYAAAQAQIDAAKSTAATVDAQTGTTDPTLTGAQ